MKNITVLTCLVLLMATTNAQDNNDKIKRHEIGLNLYSFSSAYTLTEENVYFIEYGESHTFMNGVSYRFHFKESALRFNFQYQYKDYSTDNNSGNVMWNIETRIGYERYLGSKKLKPFIAVDLLYMYGFSDVMVASCNDPLCDPWISPKFRTNMLGIVPSIGVSYQFTKRFSLRAEANATLGIFKNEEIERYGNYRNTTEPAGVLIINPVSVFSINYHL